MSIAIDSGKTLQEQAVGVKKKWGWFGIKKKFRDSEREKVAELFSADSKRISNSKTIINTSNPFYSVLTKIKSQFESYFRKNTFAWIEPEIRLLRVQDNVDFFAYVEKVHDQMKEGVLTLTKHWDELKDESKDEMGDLYQEEHFNVILEETFCLAVTPVNLDVPEYLLTANPKLYAQEKARIAKAFDKALELQIEAVGSELHKLVSDMVNKLCPDKEGNLKQIKANSVQPFREFVENFRKMNVTSNADLEALVNQAESLVCGINLKDLKQGGLNRVELAQSFEQLGLAIESKIVPKQRRKLLMGTPQLKIAEAPIPEEGVA